METHGKGSRTSSPRAIALIKKAGSMIALKKILKNCFKFNKNCHRKDSTISYPHKCLSILRASLGADFSQEN